MMSSMITWKISVEDQVSQLYKFAKLAIFQQAFPLSDLSLLIWL